VRIAYSCAGEGFGHAARMAALYPDLSVRHRVDLFVPRPVERFVAARLPEAPEIRPIPHFELAKRGNRIDYRATVFRAARLLREVPTVVLSLARILRGRRVDVVLSDFEPFLPLAARLAGVPIVQMNHPGVVLDYLDADPRSWAAALSALFVEGPSDRRVIVSFYGGRVGPVLRKSLYRHLIRDDGFLAVNLKDEARGAVLPVLDAIPGLRYRLYPSPGADFDEGLASCSAVVSGAGHQTLSEALCLGKPVLALPQEGQFEQILNARMLERSGRGAYCAVSQLPDALPRFLSRLAEYRSPRVLSPEFRLRDSRDDLLALLEDHFAALRPKSSEGFAGRRAG
jgi:UDP:flavonoid glycosyltransferase YjiC (YdhE family)